MKMESLRQFTRFKNLGVLFTVLATLSAGGWALLASVQAAPAQQVVVPSTIITVDTSTDLDPDSSRFTCGYTLGGGALIKAAEDGKCTLRRAIIEASARPDVERPIAIHFNIPVTDVNYSPNVSGTWVLSMTEKIPALRNPISSVLTDGRVIIDGTTQPNGRSDGPAIIVAMGDESFEIDTESNTIQDIAFNDGGAILVNTNASTTTIDGIWMGLSDDGQEVDFRTPGQFNRMAFGGIRLRSNGNTVRNNVLTGSFASAVDVDGSDNNLIENNWIGTRSDGSVPAVDPEIRCVIVIDDPDNPFGFYYNENDWYGGWGISLSGSNNIVRNNYLVGMNNVRSGNDTPAMAIEAFGAGHQIISNTIGSDVNGYDLGVCGQALKASGSDMDLLDNVIAGASPFNPDDPNKTAIFTNDGSPLFDRVTVRRNIVRDGIIGSTDDLYEFGPAMPDALKLFRSAHITNIEGISVTGSNGVDILGGIHHCPHCLVDVYLDDDDAREEALEWLGSTQSALDGSWTFSLTQPLSATQGLHTISTSTEETMAVSNTVPYSDSILFDYSAGMSFEASKLFLPMQSIAITGPMTASVGADQTFTMEISPTYSTNPFLYTINFTDGAEPFVRSTDKNPYAIEAKWTTPGTKSIDVTVQNDLGTLTKTYKIEVVDPLATPTPEPGATATPTATATPVPNATATPLPTATPGSFGGDDEIYLPLVTKQ